LTNHIEKNIFNKPEDYFDIEKLRKSVHTDRRVSLRELIELIYGMIPYLKTKNELLDEEFDKFDSRYMPAGSEYVYARNVFKAYILDLNFRQCIDSGNFAKLNVNPNGLSFRKISPKLRKLIPEYIKDYVSLNQFAP
jgi:type I restriction enzyme, R subunit